MVNNREAYNAWSESYDSMLNKTRDLEAKVLRTVLSSYSFGEALELGCGTGKNTEWIAAKSIHNTAVDFSEEMLEKARAKAFFSNIKFVNADITKKWNFITKKLNLVSCSLVLEHIQDLNFIFLQAAQELKANGFFYICELHPMKQYGGSKARFESGEGILELESFIHHISDYMNSAFKHNFICIQMQEWFDNDDRNEIPRLVSFLFQKINI